MPRVAVVHPIQAVRTLVAQILAAAGIAPIEAETAEDARAVMQVDPPEIAIVDEAVVGALAPLPVPWIALGRKGPRAPLVAAGACCVVEKPFIPEDLLRAVAWALDLQPAVAQR
jgi:hypothetical protein